MSTVFISYAREDKGDAEGLAQEFQMRGADPWWDRALVSGERYIETILRQVGQADHFVLLLSKYSKESTWVAFEVGAARAREFEQGRDFIKIAHIDDCEIPGFLGERNATKMDGDGLGILCRALDLPEDVDYKPPAGSPDKSLTIFRAGGQWMELVVSERGLECILVDVGEQRARIQWQMPKEQAADYLEQGNFDIVAPRDGRGWSRFSIGHCRDWRWSPALFTSSNGPAPEESFRGKLLAHLSVG